LKATAYISGICIGKLGLNMYQKLDLLHTRVQQQADATKVEQGYKEGSNGNGI
jgi:hypothetical protein